MNTLEKLIQEYLDLSSKEMGKTDKNDIGYYPGQLGCAITIIQFLLNNERTPQQMINYMNQRLGKKVD